MTGYLMLAGAAVLLAAGAELFAENAARAGRRVGVSALGIGIVLAGAEPEELVTAVLAALDGHPGLAAGDAVGANVTMLTAVLGLAALLHPVPIARRAREYAGAAVAVGLLALALLLDDHLGRWEGAALVAGYLALVAVIWRREHEPPAFGELAEVAAARGGLAADVEPAITPVVGNGEPALAGTELPTTQKRRGRALGLVVLGMAAMGVGGWFAVEGADRVVTSLGVRETAVGLTVLAFATTAELFALVGAAARRGLAQLAVAGILGSAIYNSTATLGAAALARPLDADVAPAAALAAALPLVVVFLGRSGRIGRLAGALLVATYVAFVVLALP